MFDGNLRVGALKWSIATEPLVDHDAQRVLVAGRSWMRLNLFGSHIGDGAGHILRALVGTALGSQRDTEITQQNLVVAPDQHIFRFDVAVDEVLGMRVVQRLGDLFDVVYDLEKRDARPLGVAMAQRALRSVVHHEVGRAAFDAKIQHTHDMRVGQARNRLSLRAKSIDIMACQAGKQEFDSGLCLEVNVFAKIDLGEATLPQQANETIVTQALPGIVYLVAHTRPIRMKYF